jgi:hypothetical protein
VAFLFLVFHFADQELFRSIMTVAAWCALACVVLAVCAADKPWMNSGLQHYTR